MCVTALPLDSRCVPEKRAFVIESLGVSGDWALWWGPGEEEG